MRVLVLCPHYAPDVAPTGTVMTAIADQLIAQGHELHIVTSLPWYRLHDVEPEWRGRPWRTERHGRSHITRVHPFPTDKSNLRARALGFAGFIGVSSLVALFSRRRPDVVFAMSPPLPIGVAGLVVARLRRAPFVFNIQDVFPDVAVELGLLTDRRVIRAASALERFAYRHADAVTVLSDDLRDNVTAKLGRQRRRPTRVEVIPNFVDTVAIVPASKDNDYRREHGLIGKRVVMYAGNVGLSQSIGLLLEAARVLQDRADVVFVINGGGAARPSLEAASADLPNVRFVDYQPIERLPEVLAAADVGDAVAAAILTGAAADLAAHVRTLADRNSLTAGVYPLRLTGGLLAGSATLRHLVVESLVASGHEPGSVTVVSDPAAAAARFAATVMAVR